MASRLFSQALAAAGRLVSGTRSPGRSTNTSVTVANSVLRSLGPLGQFISNMIAGPKREITRDSEAEAASQVLRQLRRLSPDRQLEVAEALVRESMGGGKPPKPPSGVSAAPQPAGDGSKPPNTPDSAASGEEEFDNVQTLGRDAFYDEEDIQRVVENEIRTPQSSNVYSYYFEQESRRYGILYVTFKAWTPGNTTFRNVRQEAGASYLTTNSKKGGGKKSDSRGPTYAYYDVPVKVWLAFKADAKNSAGTAVWDYLRKRGTTYGHQYQYRAVAGTLVQGGGVYVPRKATSKGFKRRSINSGVGVGRRQFNRSTLPERNFLPNRGRPSRGTPDRGRP